MSDILTHAIKALNEKLTDGYDGLAKFQIEGGGPSCSTNRVCARATKMPK